MASGDLWHYSSASGSVDLTITLGANAKRLVSFKLAMMATSTPQTPLTVDLYDGTGTTVTAGTATKIGSWVINTGAAYIASEPDIILYSGLTQDNKGSGYIVRSGFLRIDVTQGTGTTAQKFIPHVLLADTQ